MSGLHINSAKGKPADFYILAGPADTRQLDESRATQRPSMLVAIAVVAAIIAICIHLLDWLRVIIGLVIVAVFGAGLLVGYGGKHNMNMEQAAKTTLPGHGIFPEKNVRATAGKSYDLDCAQSGYASTRQRDGLCLINVIAG